MANPPSYSCGDRSLFHNTKSNKSSNMQKLWEGIQQSRLCIENDRKAYEKARQDIEALNQKMQKVSQHHFQTQKKIRETEELYAVRATEYSHFEIKDKVVSENLSKVQDEVKKGWDELRATRMKAMELTNRYLRESCNFSQMWNCTELGRRNRKAARAREVEELRRLKHRMEYDLEELLTKMKRVKESDQERIDLQNRYRSQEQMARNRENEAYVRLKDREETLKQLWKKQDSMAKDFEDEVNHLQQKLQQCRESISLLERRVSEAQRTLEHQRSQLFANNRSPAAVQGNTQGFNTSVSSNKSARIYQPVRPTPQVSAQKAQNNLSANPPQVMYQKQSATITRTQIHPTTASNVTDTSSSFSLSKGGYTRYTSNQKENENQSTESSYFTSRNQVSLPSSSILPNTNPSKLTGAAVANGRVFHFKKKAGNSFDDSPSNNIIPGPTSRSVTVSLGSTPFATFQNGKQILQQQKYNLTHNDTFTH